MIIEHINIKKKEEEKQDFSLNRRLTMLSLVLVTSETDASSPETKFPFIEFAEHHETRESSLEITNRKAIKKNVICV